MRLRFRRLRRFYGHVQWSSLVRRLVIAGRLVGFIVSTNTAVAALRLIYTN